MQTIHDRMLMIMAHYHWNKSDLARALKISTANASLMFSRKTNPSFDTIANLHQSAPELSIQWLITGTGPMLSKTSNSYLDIPIAGSIAAGNPIEVLDAPPIEYLSVPHDQYTGHPSHYIAFRVYGDSMAPRIIHNDIVLLCTVFDPWEMDGYVCAVKIDTEITLKKIWINHAAQQTVLLPFNCSYSPIVLDDSSPDCRIIGYVLSITRFL